jgi:WD40 repeat protein
LKVVQRLSRKGLGSLLFHPDSRLLEWAGEKIVDAQTGKEVLTVRSRGPFGFSGAVFTRDGSRLATAEAFPPGLALAQGGAPGEVRLWDGKTGMELHTFRGHVQPISSIGFSADGSRLASGSEDKNVKIWDTVSGKELLTYRGHRMRVLHVMFSADGRQIASVSIDGTLKVWDPATGKDLR